jgi:hypothetical protein
VLGAITLILANEMTHGFRNRIFTLDSTRLITLLWLCIVTIAFPITSVVVRTVLQIRVNPNRNHRV